ncbi:chromosome partitioning protein ParA [uncultured Rothia sp.]|uniref:chromosome partitioning protein ParA n=1 Tax=uncultured Rothia sp. TaxID=316088 RepID=UPI0026338AB7|nr:chromosome partitioning protein ParA [uncultured Rothia sp.]
MRRQNTLRILAGALLPLTLLLSSCASGQPSADSSASANAEKAYSASSAPQSSSASATATVDTQATEKVNALIAISDNVERAYQRLASECMVSKGYPDRKTYYMVETFPVRDLLSPLPLSVDYANKSGYPSPTPPSRYASLEDTVKMTEQETQAFYGDDGKGGCRKEAELKLYGSGTLAGTREVVTEKLLSYIRTSVINGAYSSLDGEWERCMAERGYTYSTSDIAYDAVHGKPAERQTAIDDAACREKINYEEKTEQILDTYMTTFLEKEQDFIEQVTTANKAAEENARKILS